MPDEELSKVFSLEDLKLSDVFPDSPKVELGDGSEDLEDQDMSQETKTTPEESGSLMSQDEDEEMEGTRIQRKSKKVVDSLEICDFISIADS